jgi:uncharacterized membrane protein
MNDVIDVNGKTEQQLASLRQLTLITYVLYALAWMNGITGVVALLINYIKRVAGIWSLYRLVKGLLNWNDYKPMLV